MGAKEILSSRIKGLLLPSSFPPAAPLIRVDELLLLLLLLAPSSEALIMRVELGIVIVRVPVVSIRRFAGRPACLCTKARLTPSAAARTALAAASSMMTMVAGLLRRSGVRRRLLGRGRGPLDMRETRRVCL